MEYNFLNPFFFIGLFGGGVPWALLFYRNIPLMYLLITIQVTCLLIGATNLLYGLYVILT